MANNMDKYWSDKYKKELTDLGIQFDENATKDELKAMLNAAKGEHPHTRTDEEASASIKSVVDERVSQLEALVLKMNEQLESLKNNNKESLSGLTGDALVKAIMKAADGRQDEYGLIRSEYIPEGDEIPVRVYFMAGPTTNIWGKIVAGQMTPPPHRMKFIKFKQAFGWVTKGATGIQQRRVSTYECRSKTVADWIESLPEFGLSIHLNMNGAMETSVNGQFLHLYNKHKNSLANISYGDVMEMAKSLGCPTNMGYTHDYYTGFIAEKRALDEMQSERIRFEESMRQTGVKSMVEKAQLLNQ